MKVRDVECGGGRSSPAKYILATGQTLSDCAEFVPIVFTVRPRAALLELF